MGKTKVLFVGLALQATPGKALPSKAQPITVAGWPLDTSRLPEALLSGDPLLGNLLCPALTRLNLLQLKSEPYLLQKLEVKGDRWILTPNENLKWWDERRVTLTELETFLKDELPEAVQKIGMGRWELPSMDFIQVKGQLIVQWTSTPSFGPYILNEMPLKKKLATGQLPFQCAGTLHPDPEIKSVFIDSVQAAPRLAWQNGPATPGQKKPEAPYVSFRFGEELHPSSYKRQLDEALVCAQPLDTPLITLLAWNPNGHWTKDPVFRRSMTHLLPRGALLRSGAGSLGNLISGPILRIHPGYNSRLKVPAYDPLLADKLLNSIGFKRSEDDGYRRTADGLLMEMKILVYDYEGSTLLRKVLDDSLRALGLKTIFTQNSRDPVDAVLTSIVSSWPDSNPSLFLHSASKNAPWPWRYQDPQLDKALEHYSVTLTHQKPDFTLLEKIHDVVYKLEPFSILMQHRTCLEAQLGKGKTSRQEISLRNPDWFSDLTGLPRQR